MTPTGDREERIPIWRDQRFWNIAFQVLALAAVILLLSTLFGNALRTLQSQGRDFNFGFLGNPASFNIGESVIPYQTQDPYWKAFLVGLLNTLRLILVGFVLTTTVGIFAGIASFSNNWLVRKISQVYVELTRNTPLLLQLFVWYFGVIFGLAGDEPRRFLRAIFITKLRGGGVFIPWFTSEPTSLISLGLLVAATIAAIILWKWRINAMETRGASGQPQAIALGVLGVVSIFLFFFGLNWQFPQPTDVGGVAGGLRMSLEYAAILAGLVFYTGAFIAEIVRAGIQSVSKGQWEAGRALGLDAGKLMRLIVFPQALRVIIPSLNSQYMNLAKNSSLALAIGYPDIYSTASTTFNQTGRPIEVFMLIAATYLTINLVISLAMNSLNRSVQLKER
ncbi:MAG: ABC transporter permease subunit [Cyanobacteria bacterium J06638_22]